VSIFVLEDVLNAELSTTFLHETHCFMCGKSLFDDPERSTGGIVFWNGQFE
jgi:hypothetical protein